LLTGHGFASRLLVDLFSIRRTVAEARISLRSPPNPQSPGRAPLASTQPVPAAKRQFSAPVRASSDMKVSPAPTRTVSAPRTVSTCTDAAPGKFAPGCGAQGARHSSLPSAKRTA
jgi:hypothetical protein